MNSFKSVRTKMIMTLLPAILIGLIVITALSAKSSYDNIARLAGIAMKETIASNNAKIHEELMRIEMITVGMAADAEYDYKKEKPEELGQDIIKLLEDEKITNGGGIWFEPFKYKPNMQYVCPFTFRDNGSLKLSMNYVQESGEYTPTDWYKDGKAKKHGEASLSSPYYDPAAKVVMATFSSPMYSEGDESKFIGVATVDVSLQSFADLVGAIKVGETGHAILTSDKGVYIAGVENEKLVKETFATKEGNASLAAAMTEMVSKTEGHTTYKDDNGTTQVLYYATLPDIGWHLGIIIPEAELYASARHLVITLAIVAIIVLIVLLAIVMWIVSHISTGIAEDTRVATSLAAGDFTVDAAHVETEDEIGQLGESLNNMYSNTRDIIENIAHHADDMKDSSITLGTSASSLQSGFETIKDKMRSISDEMMTASSATEEVNASAEEVSASIGILAHEAGNGLQQAADIQKRAQEIKAHSIEASKSAASLSKEFAANLAASIERGKTVEQIETMTSTISGIAQQINLLALNAAIEAARAGEAGRGFAVVATEIGKLANETAETVEHIQEMVTQVQGAFGGLSEDAQKLAGFLSDTVAPQYDDFVNVAEQYGHDADNFEEASKRISETTDTIRQTMEQVAQAMQQIANSSQGTADLTNQVSDAVASVGGTVDEIASISETQSAAAGDLENTVAKFKLKK